MALRIPSKRRVRRPMPKIRVISPGGGLNLLVSDSHIKDKEASDLNNIAFVEDGAVTKRGGHTPVGSGLTTIPKGLGVLYTSTLRRLLTIDDTKLKYLLANTWTEITGASFTTGQAVNFCQVQDSIAICNKDQTIAKYDGTTLSRPTTAPKAAFSIYYNGYHIASGVANKPDRIYISTTTDPFDFTNAAGTLSTEPEVPGASTFAGTGANFIDVGAGDGDKVTALSKFQDMLVIFKERSIFKMTFDSSGTPVLAPITNTMGAVAHKSVDNVENDIFYLSRNGFYVLGNEPNYIVIRTNELSQRVHPFIENITPANLPETACIYSDFVFYASVPYGGTAYNNRLLNYDRRYLSWSRGDSVDTNAWCEYVDDSNAKHLYYASDSEPEVYEVTTSYNDNGEAIDAYWASKAFDAGEFEIYKHWIDVTLLFRLVSGTVDVAVISDTGEVIASSAVTSVQDLIGTVGYDTFGDYLVGGDISTTTGTGPQTNNVPYRLDINKDSRTIKVRVSNNVINETFTLLGFIVTYRPYSHYQFPSSQRLPAIAAAVPATAIVTESGDYVILE